MKLNEKGKELCEKWASNYEKELAKLRKEYNDKEYYEGWFIIDNDEYVHNLEDECGLLLFGYYDDIFYIINEWEELYGKDAKIWRNYTVAEIEREILKYVDLRIDK